MRTFIRHNAAGEILSVCRTDFVSPYLTTPFGDVGLDETVLEVTDKRVLADLSIDQIHDSYKISAGTGKLIKKR